MHDTLWTIYSLQFLRSISSFRIDNSDGSESVTFKMNSRLVKLCRIYSNSLKTSNEGKSSRGSFLGDRIQVKKEKEKVKGLLKVENAISLSS